MTRNRSTFGTVGVASLLAAMVVWGVAVVSQESGANPDGFTWGVGLLSLVLLVVGMGALVKMLLEVYAVEEL